MSALLPLVITLGTTLAIALAMAPGAARADAGASLRPSESGLRIAIAPFAGEGDGESVSQQLSQRFARLGVERLLAPGSFVAERSFDPRADSVRTWASQAAVDNVVVGRVERAAPRTEARQIEAVVRSGHSGAELFRHAVHVPARAGLGSALDQLAAAIVRDLGGDPLAGANAEGVDPTPPVSAKPDALRAGGASFEMAANAEPQAAPKAAGAAAAGPSTTSAPANDKKTTDSVDARLGLGEFKSDAPIEIKADEAEIVAEGEGRRLVFTGSVWVHQDNLTLRSDFLEAEYVEGESEPRQLVARGAVRVEQGNRSARCDQARYERTSQQITCRGHAELVQGCDIVRGELIVLDLAANKARVEGAASIVISPKQGTDARCTGAASKP
jgi:lipopolysaccharide export system protein LptA